MSLSVQSSVKDVIDVLSKNGYEKYAPAFATVDGKALQRCLQSFTNLYSVVRNVPDTIKLFAMLTYAMQSSLTSQKWINNNNDQTIEWNPKQVQKLHHYVGEFGIHQWNQVSRQMSKRWPHLSAYLTGQLCKYKWAQIQKAEPQPKIDTKPDDDVKISIDDTTKESHSNCTATTTTNAESNASNMDETGDKSDARDSNSDAKSDEPKIKSENESIIWTEIHLKKLRKCVSECGGRWSKIAKRMQKYQPLANAHICEQKWIELQSKKKEKQFKCHLCDKGYTSKQGLQNHSYVHTRDYLFRCHLCGKGFPTKGNLTSHIRIHSNEKPYKCTECESRFAQKFHRDRHMRIHLNMKPFECNYCHKKFRTNNNMTCHIRTHTNERPFRCDKCESRFNQKSALINHYRIHTKEKPYKCEICGRAFAQNSTLSRHRLTHRNDTTSVPKQ